MKNSQEKSSDLTDGHSLLYDSKKHLFYTDSEKCEANKANYSGTVKKHSSTQWITLAILASGNLCTGACIALQPLLFPREAENKGISATKYGLVFSTFDIGVCLGAQITGKLVGHVRPKYILNAGIVAVGVTYILFGALDFAPNGFPFVALACTVRGMEGFGSAAIRTAAYTILASQFQEKTATNFGLIETSRGVGYVIGPTLGGVMYDLGGYGLPFYVMGALELFIGLIIFCMLPDLDGSKKEKASFLKFWMNPGVMIYFLVIFTTLNTSGFVNANLEPHLRPFNLSATLLGLIYSLTGFMFAVGSGFWGWLSDKKLGNKILILIACSIMVAAQILVGPLPFFKMEPMLGVIILSLVLFGIAVPGKLVNSFTGALEDTISRGFPRDLATYGLVSSAFVTAESLGAFTGPSLGGFLVDDLGYRMATVVFLCIEIFTMITLLMYMCCKTHCESSTEDEKTPLAADSRQTSYS